MTSVTFWRLIPTYLFLFALLSVQYGAALHSVEHPFHAHHDHYNHDHEKPSSSTDSQDHISISCDVYFAAERLSHAPLVAEPTISTPCLDSTVEYYSLLLSITPYHTRQPRSRSPPPVFS